MEHGGRHCGWDTRKAVAGGGTVLDGETGKGMRVRWHHLGWGDKEENGAWGHHLGDRDGDG